MKKFLFDLFPLILFFVAYRFADIYVATAVAMAAAVIQILWIKLSGKPIETMHWVNLAVIVFFGGATLWLQNEAFIKWKPTVLYWLFGGVLLVSKYVLSRNLMQKLLGAKVSMPDNGWDKLNLSWALFFLAAGALNLFVAFSGLFTESQWVNFKVFGLMALLIVFVIAQSIWLGKHMQHDEGAETLPAPGSEENKR
ncbi:septation protein A [Zwartia sp.]|uniref:septation protein A n=1 Tax=Zwartia sp. TaxID=2978004 RepID=UPI00272856C0|nr:septation protein A [Zwartia sp.]MDO9023404.1 septation protein A [Zwartia sp.]